MCRMFKAWLHSLDPCPLQVMPTYMPPLSNASLTHDRFSQSQNMLPCYNVCYNSLMKVFLW